MGAIDNIPATKQIGDKFLNTEYDAIVAGIKENREAIATAASGFQGDIAPTDNFVPAERPKGYYKPTVLGASYGPTGNKYLEVPENPDGEGDSYIYQVVNNGVTITLAKTIVPTGDFITNSQKNAPNGVLGLDVNGEAVGYAKSEELAETNQKVDDVTLVLKKDSSGNIMFVDDTESENIALIIQPNGKVLVGDFQSKNIVLSEFQLNEDGGRIWGIYDNNGNIAIELTNDYKLRIKSIEVLDGLPGSDITLKDVKFVYGYPTDIVAIIPYGQSNSVGSGNAAPLTLTQKYDSLQPNSGRNTADSSLFTSFVPQQDASRESPLGGLFEFFIERVLANTFIGWQDKDFQLFGFTPGQGSTTISGLSKGTAPYNKLISVMQKGYQLAISENKTFSVGAIPWIQGEANGTTSAEAYITALRQLKTDLNTDIKAITGQKNSILFPNYQMTFTSSNATGANQYLGISEAHLQIGLQDYDSICACPTYQMFYDVQTEGSDEIIIHFNSVYRRILGAYMALAIESMFLTGRKFLPTHITSATVEGNDVLLYCHVPVGSLVIDVSDVPNYNGQYGFRVTASGGSNIPITGVEIVGGNCIKLVCSSSPAGGRVFYANDYANNANTNLQERTGNTSANPLGTARFYARGCIHDSQGDYIKFDGYPMHNWLVKSFIQL